MPLYRTFYPVLEGATIATLWWELAFPYMILFRRLRPIALWIGVVVHGGIAVLLTIGWWGPLMLLSYLSFLTGRPFRRASLLHRRQRRAQVPRSERVTLEYDVVDAAAVDLAARIARADGARLVRLVPRPGRARLLRGGSELSGEDAARCLRRLLRWPVPFSPAARLPAREA